MSNEQPTDVTIEPAESDDVAELVELWIDLATDQRRYGSRLRPTANRPVVREAMARRAVSETALLARRNGTALGFVTFELRTGRYRQDAVRGLIDNLYVRAGDRNDGIGGALLARAETELEARGADTVSLQVMARNDDAERFYRRHGYGQHRIELEKPINGDTENTNDG